MNREEVIRMAREAGISPIKGRIGDDFMDVHWAELERFAALVAAAERERCAKVADEYTTHPALNESMQAAAEAIAQSIRALP